MSHLEADARAHAQRTNSPCWLVTPIHGQRYIAYSPAAIPSRFMQVIPVVPTPLHHQVR